MQHLFGSHPSSSALADYISSLFTLTNQHPIPPEIKSYPDAVYFNYFAVGLSLLFSPINGYKPATELGLKDLHDKSLVLESIDLYNVPKRNSSNDQSKAASSRSAELAFSTFPVVPFTLSLVTKADDKRPLTLDVLPETTGKEFVVTLGEPDRKGGGAGPSSGSIGIWCEWSKDGIMVEFGGDEAKGPQAWERGKDAVWKIITVFRADNVER